MARAAGGQPDRGAAVAPGDGAVRTAQDRRDAILRAAARLLAGAPGGGQVQMAQVAEEAGVALATVYRYFSSKGQLLAAAGAGPAAPAAVPLSEAQQARRRRIVAAAVRLLATSFYEKVQMTDVADEAGVALGTVYRYFRSKEHLVAEALLEWARLFEGRIRDRPPRSASTEERLVELYSRALRAHLRSPQYYSAFRAIELSDDADARRCLAEVQSLTERLYVSNLGPDLPARVARLVTFMCSAVLEALIIRELAGQVTPEQAMDTLTGSIRVLCHGI